ncbi:MAG: polyprenyl synthetase family protein [Anaerolineales bacterium]|nr:MAG: polyprenyl synthetase family protein [Anaerolineales bacterium]
MQKPSFIGPVVPQTATFFDLSRSDLERVEDRLRERRVEHHPNLDLALDHLLASGGKRIRPIAAILTGQLLGANPESIITHAAAIEMLHTATLVHDDLIDGSLVRRGIPTLNAKWSSGATVLTGDYIFARAAHLAAETGSLALMKAFARTLMTIVNGEITQLFGDDFEDSLKAYQQRIYAKTASLFEVATEGAALLSNCDPDTIEAMKRFGYYIGMAFQIVDDILDFTGNPNDVGKPVGNDIRQGLITLPALYFLEKHPDRVRMMNQIDTSSFSEEQIERLISEIRGSDCIPRAMQQAKDYIEEGQTKLALLPAVRERDGLRDLAQYVVTRST